MVFCMSTLLDVIFITLGNMSKGKTQDYSTLYIFFFIINMIKYSLCCSAHFFPDLDMANLS